MPSNAHDNNQEQLIEKARREAVKIGDLDIPYSLQSILRSAGVETVGDVFRIDGQGELSRIENFAKGGYDMLFNAIADQGLLPNNYVYGFGAGSTSQAAEPTSYYFAEYCPEGVGVPSEDNVLFAFYTVRERDEWVGHVNLDLREAIEWNTLHSPGEDTAPDWALPLSEAGAKELYGQDGVDRACALADAYVESARAADMSVADVLLNEYLITDLASYGVYGGPHDRIDKYSGRRVGDIVLYDGHLWEITRFGENPDTGERVSVQLSSFGNSPDTTSEPITLRYQDFMQNCNLVSRGAQSARFYIHGILYGTRAPFYRNQDHREIIFCADDGNLRVLNTHEITLDDARVNEIMAAIDTGDYDLSYTKAISRETAYSRLLTEPGWNTPNDFGVLYSYALHNSREQSLDDVYVNLPQVAASYDALADTLGVSNPYFDFGSTELSLSAGSSWDFFDVADSNATIAELNTLATAASTLPYEQRAVVGDVSKYIFGATQPTQVANIIIQGTSATGKEAVIDSDICSIVDMSEYEPSKIAALAYDRYCWVFSTPGTYEKAYEAEHATQLPTNTTELGVVNLAKPMQDVINDIDRQSSLGCSEITLEIEDVNVIGDVTHALLDCGAEFSSDGETLHIQTSTLTSTGGLAQQLVNNLSATQAPPRVGTQHEPTRLDEPKLKNTARATDFEHDIARARETAHTQSKQTQLEFLPSAER